MEKAYETVIGLEVHVELATKTKIFCGCSTRFGAEPNTQICPVCAGLPGALPVLNRQVVEHALAVGLALHCAVNRHCRFDRKNYFYPDNPQNYQISQLYLPICYNGWIPIETDCGEKRIGIHELHMEEDAGKLFHDAQSGCTRIDYNRSGVPLIEIVSEPDLRSAEEVLAYLEKLRLTIQYLGASDCKLQEGSMRVDVNLSVREEGQKALGTRTEMKNLGSFKAIRRAIASERERQIAVLESGGQVRQETRRFDESLGRSFPMRSKENANDYRYFPEPDLMRVEIDADWLEAVRRRQPELRDQKRKRYQEEYGLPAYDAKLLTESRALAELFEQTAALCGRPKQVSNWLMGETLRLLKEENAEPETLKFSPEHLAALIDLTEQRRISQGVAKQVFERMFYEDVDPVQYVKAQGLEMVNDASVLRAAAEQVLAENSQSVSDYLAGKERALGYLVGQTMKRMQGKANPAAVQILLRELLAR